MLRKKELKMCKLLINIYKKKLNKYVENNTKLNAESICNEYIERFYKYMNNVDQGQNDGKFTSYLNIFSGLCAYEILREKGLSGEQGINAYNEMCAEVRNKAIKSKELYGGNHMIKNAKSLMDNKFLFMGDATSNGTSIEIEELDINLNGNNKKLPVTM